MGDREQLGPLRVLVVEDCPDTRRTTAQLLRLWGCQVREAADGPEALAEVDRRRPDVVLLDLGLPGMDGFETARRLRLREGAAFIWLVALTGYASEADQRRAREAGCDCHLAKPADPDLLQQLLDAWRSARDREPVQG
jgi:CheY-like chemotaxis protein